MKKFLKILTMCFILIGAVFLIGIAGSASGSGNGPGPVVSSATLSKKASGITLIKQNQKGMIVRMDIGKVNFVKVNTKKGSFILPQIPKFTRSFKVGEPALPIAAELISIPFDCKLQTKVLDYKIKEVNIPGLLMPVQPPLSKSTDPRTVPFEYNRAIYTTPGKYALPLVSTEIMGIMRATRIGRLAISPVEYFPMENRARVYTSVTVQIAFKNANWQKTKQMRKKYASFFFEPAYRQLLNHKADDYLKADLVKYPVKYVIVADPMFE